MVLKIILYVLPILTLLSDKEYNIIPLSITALSIIFGFVFAAICSVYNNQKFNIVIKHNKQMDKFIEDNKRFLNKILILLILDFVFAMLPDIVFTYHIVKIHTTQIVIYIGMIYILLESFEFIRNFFIIYKNSYSDYADNLIKELKQKESNQR